MKGKRGRKERGYAFNVFGGITKDEEIEKLLLQFSMVESPLQEEYYLKHMGSKKIARYIRNVYGIIVNHKKLHRLRKKLGLVGKYKRRERHPYNRSRSMTVTKANQLWEKRI